MQPPQNPYEGFPNPNDPLPPPLPGQGLPFQGAPPRGPEISFDVISQAWTVLQSSMGVYIGATFVALIPVAIAYMVYLPAILNAPKDAAGQPQINQLGAGPFLILFLGLGIYALLIAGVLKLAIHHLKTGKADFAQVFSAFGSLPRLILAFILVMLGTYAGMCLCFVPGLLLSGLWMFVAPLILDRRLGVIDAMRTSFQAVRPHMWMAVLFIIVLSLVAQVGGVACGVGALVTIPLAIISFAITYRNFFPDGESGFNFPTHSGPVAPIADPLA